MGIILAFKYTKPDGTAWYDGKTEYVPGSTLEVLDADPDVNQPCGKGLHISKSMHQAGHYGEDGGRFFEVEVNESDVICHSVDKIRVRRLRVIKELVPSDCGVIRGPLWLAAKFRQEIGYDEEILYGCGFVYGEGYGNVTGSGFGYGHGLGDGYGFGLGPGETRIHSGQGCGNYGHPSGCGYGGGDYDNESGGLGQIYGFAGG